MQKEPIFLLNGEVIWQASDSPLSKELHGVNKPLIESFFTDISFASGFILAMQKNQFGVVGDFLHSKTIFSDLNFKLSEVRSSRKNLKHFLIFCLPA